MGIAFQAEGRAPGRRLGGGGLKSRGNGNTASMTRPSEVLERSGVWPGGSCGVPREGGCSFLAGRGKSGRRRVTTGGQEAGTTALVEGGPSGGGRGGAGGRSEALSQAHRGRPAGRRWRGSDSACRAVTPPASQDSLGELGTVLPPSRVPRSCVPRPTTSDGHRPEVPVRLDGDGREWGPVAVRAPGDASLRLCRTPGSGSTFWANTVVFWFFGSKNCCLSRWNRICYLLRPPEL